MNDVRPLIEKLIDNNANLMSSDYEYLSSYIATSSNIALESSIKDTLIAIDTESITSSSTLQSDTIEELAKALQYDGGASVREIERNLTNALDPSSAGGFREQAISNLVQDVEGAHSHYETLLTASQMGESTVGVLDGETAVDTIIGGAEGAASSSEVAGSFGNFISEYWYIAALIFPVVIIYLALTRPGETFKMLIVLVALSFLLIVEIHLLIILQNIIRQVVWHLNLLRINKK